MTCRVCNKEIKEDMGYRCECSSTRARLYVCTSCMPSTPVYKAKNSDLISDVETPKIDA